ncbi:MAG TPA: CxxxxCH/CxxCH domain-containing protein, partial [Anaeromyxobacteraceae bacterium]|nr:CxxxxCH/CxxCH domain-containing protein [Anaeromyxobacteraceae bacterium]
MAIAAGACGERTDPNGAVGSPAPAARSTAAAASAPNHAIYAANGIACATCHPCGERSPGGHGAPWMDAASSGFHAYAANAGLSACQACHGTGLDGAGGTTAVSCAMCHGAGWRTSCTGCHGGTDGTSGAPPRATWGNSADAIRVGAHTAHLAAAHGLSKPVECASCHVVPPDALSAGHVDGPTATVAFSGLATAAGALPTWSRAAASCASTYCHGATLSGGAVAAPVWTLQDGTQRACGACHGAPPPPPHVASTDCGACHAGYGPSTVVAATHVDGKLDVVALSCNSCHGSAANAAPPYGTRGEVSTTTVAVGAHQRHLAGGPVSRPVACSECHVEPASMRHADGSVQLAFGPLATTDASPATWDPTSLTCTNYCHGAILRGGGTNLAPLWTGGPSQVTCGSCHQTPPPAPHPHTQVCENCHPGYTVTSVNQATHVNGLVEAENLTCASCHGDTSRVLVMQADPLAVAAPPYGTRGETDPASRSVGQHQAHVNRGDGLALPNKCRYCHAVPTTFDHADGVSLVTFGSLATMDGAAPTFDGSTCSNTYCHGSTLGRGGTGHSPTWTTPAAVTCGSCHGVPPPLPHPQDSDCIRCHPGYTSTSVRKWTHVNGISDFPSGCNSCHDIPPNSGAHYEHLHERVACDRCHAGYTTTAANETLHRNARQDVTLAGWNPSTRTCSGIGCHGSEYWGRTGTAARQSCNQCHGVPPRSGEHYEHSEYACSRCHGTGYTTTTTNAATHMSGTVDVPFAFYDRTTHTCTSTGCHGTQRWGTPVPVVPNCSNCHGFPPPLPHPQDSACQSCHPSMLATGVLTADHNNGTLDISGQGCQSCHGFPPTSTRKGAIHPTDANCYGCHSTTVDASNQIVPNGTHNDGYVQVGGGGVGTYGCQTCHGDQARQAPAGADANVKAAPPLGTRGESEPTTRAVGAHLAHVSPAAGTLAGPAACAECHPVPTAMDHAGGTVLIAFGGRATLQGATPAYDPAAVTCSSTYCHGSTLGAGGTRHAPTWTGGAAETACGTCHDAPPPGPHPQTTNCGGCHPGSGTGTPNPAVHVDGALDLKALTCSSCHGDSTREATPLAPLYAAPPVDTTGSSDPVSP